MGSGVLRWLVSDCVGESNNLGEMAAESGGLCCRFVPPITCHADPAKEPADKTPLNERRYTSLSSVQSLYVVVLKLSLRTRLARQTHARCMPNP
jgi:hypothetical protein